MRRARALALVALTLVGALGVAPRGADPRTSPVSSSRVLAGYRAGQPALESHRGSRSRCSCPACRSTTRPSWPAPACMTPSNLQREFAPSFVARRLRHVFPGAASGDPGRVCVPQHGTGEPLRDPARHSLLTQATSIPSCAPPWTGKRTRPSARDASSFGVVGRMTPGGGVYPYARANAGVLARTRSAIEMVGAFSTARAALPAPSWSRTRTPATRRCSSRSGRASRCRNRGPATSCGWKGATFWRSSGW